MYIPQKIICVHNGALGDFLQAWPALYCLTQNWPVKEFFWAGRTDYSLWTKPLGFKSCDLKIMRLIQGLYSFSKWPQDLEDYLVIWFGLSKNPLAVTSKQLWFLPGLDLDHDYWLPPMHRYARQLISRNLKWETNWQEAWKSLISPVASDQLKNNILLFPGSGHRAKCWPLEYFIELAQWLRKEQNKEIVFVLGPVEQERGLMDQVKKIEQVSPRSLQELQVLLLKSRLVIGNDCGPMHLAGVMGIDTLTLFGPACARQWGTWQGKTIQSPAQCSPCTQTARIVCEQPVCMSEITVQSVQQYILDHNLAVI